MTTLTKKGPAETIVLRHISSSQIWIYIVCALLILTTIYGFITIETKGVNLLEAAKKTASYFALMFGTPKAVPSHFGVVDESFWKLTFSSLNLVLQTLSLAVLTTLIGAVVALILGLFAASNLTNRKVSSILKSIIAFIRAVPTVLWVLIFAIGAGLGAAAAVIGMSFHTVGYLMKAYAESFEELDHSVIEALRASGASWIQIVFQAVLPSSITQIISWTFIRLEINFAVAVAMGAAAGAGGIGFNLFMSASYYFNICEIGFITYQILIVALIMEIAASRLKAKLRLQT